MADTKQIYSITGMTCNGCANTVSRVLTAVSQVTDVKVNLSSSTVEISANRSIPMSELQAVLLPYPAYQLSEEFNSKAKFFWRDASTWKRAGFNTLNCLIGCSIGDFFMIIFLQRFFPATGMAIQMILATTAGLITSVLMETILLATRERFALPLAFRTAISMSFLSMIAMELVMNATDFMITGGKAAFGNPLYWTALLVAMVAGFIAPLPYNYYKLKKYNRACH